MFRAVHPSSSGAPNCICCLWFIYCNKVKDFVYIIHSIYIYIYIYIYILYICCWLFLLIQTAVHGSMNIKFKKTQCFVVINPLKPELNSICYLLALLGAHHFLHVSRIRVKLLTFRLLMSYIYGAPILDVSRSHTTTQHSR